MDTVINNSIKFLTKNQETDGSFLSLTSSSRIDFKKATKCQSIFSSALILSCLNELPYKEDEQLNLLKKKTADFLRSQKSEHWSFNYWVRDSKQAELMPYPDDLDDTACALSALYEYDKSQIDGEVLAKVVAVLTALEVKTGGPYRTWLVPPNAQKDWLDVDLAVNSNVGYFLHLQEVTLKNVTKLIETAIDNNDYSSPYYPSVYSIIYFISRFYKGKKTKAIIDFLLAQKRGNTWGNSLDTALAVLSLLNFGYEKNDLKKSAAHLLQKRKEDGSWGASPFYIGINPKQYHGDTRKHYSGSSSLTTAFCILAISKLEDTDHLKNRKSNSTQRLDKDTKKIQREIIHRAQNTFSQLGDDLKDKAMLCLKKTATNDKDGQIILLPYFFARGLKQKEQEAPHEKLIDLCLANLYGWIAYTIYDDFLDEEGDPQLLSVANVAMRESYTIFLKTHSTVEFADFVKSIFERIDSANAWEVAHCRAKDNILAGMLAHQVPNFNDVANLSDRSLGIAIAPIGILAIMGHKLNSKTVKNVLEGFRQYITAKQIHDDMHDWKEDLSRGQLNSSSAALILLIKKTKTRPKDTQLDMHFLQQKFWEEVVVVLCKRTFVHLDCARKLFLSSGISESFVNTVLHSLYASTELTLREQGNAKKFLATYGGGK